MLAKIPPLFIVGESSNKVIITWAQFIAPVIAGKDSALARSLGQITSEGSASNFYDRGDKRKASPGIGLFSGPIKFALMNVIKTEFFSYFIGVVFFIRIFILFISNTFPNFCSIFYEESRTFFG